MDSATTGIWILPPVSEATKLHKEMIQAKIAAERATATLAQAYDEAEKARERYRDLQARHGAARKAA